MKKFITAAFCITISIISFAITPNLYYAVPSSCDFRSPIIPLDIVADHNDNLIAISLLNAYITPNTEFWLNDSTCVSLPNNSHAYLIYKYNHNGHVLWYKVIENVRSFAYNRNSQKYSSMITVSPDNSITFLGYTDTITDIDPSSGVLQISGQFTSTGSSVSPSGYFLVRLDKNGNFIWGNYTGSTNTAFMATEMEIDNTGNIIVVGQASGHVDLNPLGGAADTIINRAGFVQKLDNNGNYLSSFHMDCRVHWAACESRINSVAIDDSNNVIISGNYIGDYDIKNGPDSLIIGNFPDNNGHGFILKMDSNLLYTWHHSFKGVNPVGNISDILSNRIRTDSYGAIYVEGFNTSDTFDLDPGIGVKTVKLGGKYMRKFDRNGKFVWGNSLGPIGIDPLLKFEIDCNDKLFRIGLIGLDSVNLNIYNNNPDLAPKYGDRYYIAEYDTQGNLISAITNQGTPYAYLFEFSCQNSFYAVVGWTSLTFAPYDFDPSSGYYRIWQAGSFLSKWAACTGVNTYDSVSVTACEPYFSPQGFVYGTNSFQPPYNYTIFDTIPNFAGCDSIITTDLTVFPRSNILDTIVDCNEHTTPDGTTHYISGSYADTSVNSLGCDSINKYIFFILPLDTSLTINGNIITANANVSNYEWIDCASGQVITGENGKSFIGQVGKSYAVIIYYDLFCTHISQCIKILTVDTEEYENIGLSIYPNPAQSQLFVQSHNTTFNEWELLNLEGKQIQYGVFSDNDFNQIELNEKTGIYMLHLKTKQGNSAFRKVAIIE